MNFILFNGPPRSGKDTAARLACDIINNERTNRLWPVWEKFSYPNKRAFAGMMSAPIDDEGNVLAYEYTKDTVIHELGVSYRQWQMDYSEKFMKPLYGNDIFGRLLLARCARWSDKTFIPVVSDCGFQIEVDTLRDHNVLLIRMERKGCTFEGDSREYVAPRKGWSFLACMNNGSIPELHKALHTPITSWLVSL